MAQPKSQNDLLVLDSAPAGIDKIPAGTPLTRLNYYDGLFLRAAHLDAEQRYVRALAGFANQGLGPGLVHGFSAELESGGDTLVVRAGLAFDAQGRTLFLPRDVKVGVQELIERSRQAAPGSSAPGGLLVGEFSDCTVVAAGGGTSSPVPEGTLYQIIVCHLEALCGQEDVYGRVCEQACATDVERPWRVEGVVLRALPLTLATPFPQSLAIPLGDERFLRSNVAHSFFEDERRRHPHLISAAGLRSPAWCRGAGVDLRGCEVPLGVLAREGNVSLFLDPWVVRRERMETPSRRYWDWRMWMRPWDVFLAQVLQFQCQLADGPASVPETDPCAPERKTLGEGVQALEATLKQIQESSPDGLPPFAQDLSALRDKLAALARAPSSGSASGDAHVLLDRGVAELPPAGWLPVVSGQIVQGQVRALLGQGVDLRFCVVRPDYIGHALEEAQHLERISLTVGLDDPKQLQEVDILVPNGALFQTAPPPQVQTGTIGGRVLTPAGGSVPGIPVTAQALSGGAPLTTVTDSKSNFAFENLAPGVWQVSANVPGFGLVTKPANVVAGQTTDLDLVAGGTSIVVDPPPGATAPPAPTVPPAGARPILATLDWVFFHRRRDKKCGGEPPAPPPVQTRKYRLLHFAQDFPIERIKSLLADPAAAPAFVKLWQSVASMEFDKSSAQLLGPTPAALLTAWQAVAPGDRLLLVALLATPGSDETKTLEETRGKLVVDIVRDGQPADDLKGDVLADVPDAVRQNFNLAADEGFLLIESLGRDGAVTPPPPPPPPVLLQQHEVFLANADQLKAAQLAARNGSFGANHVGPLERLGLIDFKPGTSDPTPDSLEAFSRRWLQFTGGAPVAGALSVSATAAATPTRTLHRKQAQFLAEKLGTSVSATAGTATALPSSAATVTLLTPVTPG